jgi:AAA domain
MTIAVPRQRLVPIRWGEIQLLPKREPLIEGIFDVGAMSALVGASGAYKTGIAVDWAGHIGTGMPWRGHRVRKGVALYLAVEGGRGIAERFEAWRQYKGISADDGDVYVIPEPIDLAHGEDTKLLLKRIADIGRVDFIVADTVSRALAGGDENSSKDMGGFVRNCDLIRGETGAHICGLHHLGKDESRGARGHSLLKAALDTELIAIKAGRVGTLELTKQRDGLDGTRWGFAIESVDVSEGKRSFVVVSADTPTMAKSSRWTRGLSVFRDAVTAAIIAEGEDHRPGGDGAIVKAVPVECAKSQHNRLYVHSGDGDRSEAERKAWRRALQTARGTQLIGSESSCGRDLIWLAS